MNPNDPSLPTELVAGPYGFLVVIFFCLFWGLREWRKGREVDVDNQKKRAEEAERRADAAEARADTLDNENEQKTTILLAKIEGLKTEIQSLRDGHFRELERSMAKYYECRRLLMEQGVPPERIP